MLRSLFLGLLSLVLVAPAPAFVRPADEAAPMRYALHAAKVLTMDDEDHVYTPGTVLVEDGRITWVGPGRETPEGFTGLDYPTSWITPGMVDLHTHVHTGSWGDINDMVRAINPELRTSPTIRAGNPNLKRACAAGVTTLFGIPGSGTNISGFGVLYKSKGGRGYESAVLADPGGMKVAQDSNPQRRAGDMGASRAGMGWNLEDINQRALAAIEQDRFDPALENLKRVHKRELPVLIHTAGSEGVVNTARMWRVTYDTRSVLSHGSFDGWKVASALAEIGIPINHGPRTTDWFSSRNGRINNSAGEYQRAGGPNFSLNTDSGVIPQEEFFLQGAMGARYDGDAYGMLRAMTIHPAKAFGIDDRVGSLEVGKDADVVVRAGDPLDPRAAVELVLIDGRLEYDRLRDGQRF